MFNKAHKSGLMRSAQDGRAEATGPGRGSPAGGNQRQGPAEPQPVLPAPQKRDTSSDETRSHAKSNIIHLMKTQSTDPNSRYSVHN